MIKKPLFLVLEGIDCSGKSTLLELLKTTLPKEPEILNYFENKIIYTFEPGGINSKITNNIRELIFKNKGVISNKTEALLFFAARAEHLDKVIIPAIKNQSLVICDRYFLSTLVYQGHFGNNNIKWLNENMNYISENIKPDATFFIDISKEEHEKFFLKKHQEQKTNTFDLIYQNYEEMKSAYLKSIDLIKQNNEKILFIENIKTLEDKSKYIIETIKQLINQ